MGRHSATRTFTIECFRLLISAPNQDNQQAARTFAYANESCDDPMNGVFSRPLPERAVHERVVVMDTVIVRDNDAVTADPRAVAAITTHAIPTGSSHGVPWLPAPASRIAESELVRQVSYTAPRVTRFARRTGISFYAGDAIFLDDLYERALHVTPVQPRDDLGHTVVDYDDAMWDSTMCTPGTDIEFDMTWPAGNGIVSASRLTFDV